MSDSASDPGIKGISLFRTDASMLKTEVSAAELKYRETEFSSERELLKKPRIDCTVCTKNLKSLVISGQNISAHPSLQVILCDKCKEFYGDGNFSVDEDGSDKYCRWCGNGGNLYCCSYCSVAICLKCVKRNFAKSYLNEIESDDWRCFVCDTKPIWPHRALCWAAMKHIRNGQKKIKRSKVEVSSESEDATDLAARRSKRTRKASTDENEPQKRNKAGNTKRSPVSSGDDVLAKSEPVRTSPRKRDAVGKQRKSKRAGSCTDSSPTSNSTRNQLKFMEHVITDTLQDFDKLMTIMVQSKTKYVERYVKNRRFLRDVENIPVLKQKLLELLEHCEQSMAFVRQNFVSNLKNFDLAASDNNDHDEIMEVDQSPAHSVCSQDQTEPLEVLEVSEVVKESANLQMSENGDVADAAGDDGSCSTVERTMASSNAEDEIDSARSDTEVDETKANDTKGADTSEDGVSPTKSTGEMSPTATSTQLEEDAPVSPAKATVETSLNETVSSQDESMCVATQSAAASDSEDAVKMAEVGSQNESVLDAEMAVAGPSGVSAPCNKDKLAKVAMLQFSSSDQDSSPEKESGKELSKDSSPEKKSNKNSSEKESNKSSEADISGIGPLKPDAEETKLKKKKKRKERDEAKKSFLRDSSSSDDENKAVDRLTNLSSLRRRKKVGNSEEEVKSSEEDLVAESEAAAKPEKKNKKSSLPQTKNKSWAMDFVCSGSGSEDDNGLEASFSKFNTSLEEKRKDFSINKDEISKKILLESTDSEGKSESENDLLLDDKDSSRKKKDRNKVEKPVNGDKSSGDEAAEADGDDSDNVNQKKKSKWKNDKLLKGKLSETDTSDDERQVARALKKKEKEKEEAKENGDDSSDSEDIFRPSSKVSTVRKKRKLEFSSSGSEAVVNELLSSSVEEISDDSDEPKKKTKKRKRVKNNMDSDESEDEAGEVSQTPGSASKGRKNIRKVLKDEEVAEQTRRTAKEEEERKKRIAERQALFNKSFQVKDTSDQMLTKLVLDFDEKTKEELVAVHPQLLKKLKPHQAEGVKFMWDSCYESLKQIEKGVGGGCILAHCMGLGKTLQVITLVYTLLTHEATKVKSVLVICPLSTVLNWVSEFKTWLEDLPDYEDLTIYELTKYKNLALRVHTLKMWSEEGGIMVIGYDMFRSLVQGRNAREKIKKQIHKALLDPGPDLVVCDEGHMLKNEKTAISKATVQIKSLRRIVLTGTPLQNNLIEYHCMMQFVKPNLLGEKKEFQNRFVNPITNGQYVDSTPRDVKLMKRRAHVLHKMLDGIVQRFDYKVLTPFLPPKHEFVISVALSDLQAKLYEYYIKNKSLTVAAGSTTLFKDYQIMRLIWTHPMAMKLNHDRRQKQLDKERYDDKNDSEGSLKDFVVSGSDDESSKSDSSSGSDKSVISVSSDSGKKKQKNGKPKGRLTRAQRKEMGIEADEIENALEYEPVNDWWHQFVDESDVEDYKQGPKLVLLFAILKQCELIGDKVLIFSQSIPSLDMIEYFLQKSEEFSQRVVGEDSLAPEDDLADYIGTWNKGEDYFRLDGQTPNDLRAHYCQIFNRPDNTRSRLFLISTKAGGLGINLTAANRVIIFDASWNPSYDIQSIFRVFRFGQNKPCYIYRFLSQGTMEEKIYERQVTKLSISCRVVDEQQIDRHFTRNEVAELYNFNRKMPSPDEIPKLPSDRLMAELLKEYKDLILSYHEHDSLLENVADEDLTEEEKKAAWLDYEQEKNRPLYVPPPMPRDNAMFEGLGRNIDNQAIMTALKNEHPTANTQQLLTMFNMVRSKLERYYQEQMWQSMGQPMGQPQLNIPPNPGAAAATSKELQDQLRMRKAALMHQLQTQAAAGKQPDVNPDAKVYSIGVGKNKIKYAIIKRKKTDAEKMASGSNSEDKVRLVSSSAELLQLSERGDGHVPGVVDSSKISNTNSAIETVLKGLTSNEAGDLNPADIKPMSSSSNASVWNKKSAPNLEKLSTRTEKSKNSDDDIALVEDSKSGMAPRTLRPRKNGAVESTSNARFTQATRSRTEGTTASSSRAKTKMTNDHSEDNVIAIGSTPEKSLQKREHNKQRSKLLSSPSVTVVPVRDSDIKNLYSLRSFAEKEGGDFEEVIPTDPLADVPETNTSGGSTVDVTQSIEAKKREPLLVLVDTEAILKKRGKKSR